VARVAATPPPPALAPGEKWIDVDLSEQTLVAYEGERPVLATMVSTGKEDFDTPSGDFRIRSKHVATTMDGNTATDGPYSIEDVPWTMYFHRSYALHGAFWHRQLASPGHGCVNLSPSTPASSSVDRARPARRMARARGRTAPGRGDRRLTDANRSLNRADVDLQARRAVSLRHAGLCRRIARREHHRRPGADDLKAQQPGAALDSEPPERPVRDSGSITSVSSSS
jgi:hypothetical protein